MVECRLCLVPPNLVRDIWPIVSGAIRQAIKRGDLGPFWPTEQAVLNGTALLWVALSEQKIMAAAVTDIVESEWRKVCEIKACGGKERSQWLGLIEQIEDYARSKGCTATRIIGRIGWGRVLPQYNLKRIVLEKAL